MDLPPNDFVTACVAGIPLHLFGPLDQPGAPLVFVAHGRGGAAVREHGRCRRLAAMGLIAVALDQRNHGPRMVDVRCNDGWGPTHAADMYGVMLGTACDISLLTDLLPARLGVGAGAIGVTGTSLGGHASLLAMAMNERINVGAPLIGSGDYRRLMETRCVANEGDLTNFERAYPPALAAAVEKFDPIHNAAVFADRPLLMVNGEADTLVPIECNERFVAAAAPHYSRADRLQLVGVPEIAHAVTDEMAAQADAWLARWLKEAL